MLEDRLHNFDDIVFSCFLPDDWLNEFRMPQHVLVYVYAGFLIKRTFMILVIQAYFIKLSLVINALWKLCLYK